MNHALASFIFSEETLFTTKDKKPAEIKEAMPFLETPFLKKINTDTLILTNTLSTQDKELLNKILVAVNQPDVTIIEKQNLSEYDLSKVKVILSFGEIVFPLSSTSEKYKIKIQNNIKLVLGDSLKVIGLNQNNEKKQLWSLLKPLFGIV